MTRSESLRIPTRIAGVTVEHDVPLRPVTIRGEDWITLRVSQPEPTGDPDDETDFDWRLWEFSLTTGRLVQTHGRDS